MRLCVCDWCGCATSATSVRGCVDGYRLSCAVGLGDSWLLLMIGQALRAAINPCVIVRSHSLTTTKLFELYACAYVIALEQLALKTTRVLV